MEITQNSAFLRWWNGFWAALCAMYGKSRCARGLNGFERAVSGQARDSRVCTVLRRQGTLPKYWGYSLFYRIVNRLINLVPDLFRWLNRKLRGVADGSAVVRLLTWAGDRMYALLGLFFFAMLIAPHALWNNLYGLAGALILLLIMSVWMARRRVGRIRPAFFGVYFALYGVMLVYGFVFSESRSLSLRFFLFHTVCFLIVIMVVSAVRSYAQLKIMLAAALAGLTVCALYGCYQGAVGVQVVASQADMALNAGMPGRIYSFFDNPNNFAEILVMLMPFYLALFLNARGGRRKLIVLIAALPAIGALGMTYSRSGWIGIALAVLIFLAFQNWRFIPLCIVLGLAALPLLPQTIINRVLTIGNTQDTSTMYRFAIYEAVFRLLKDYWAAGVGLGSDVVKQAFQNYPTMFDGNYPIHSHNNYLQIWTETGILGLLAYLSVLFYQIKAGVKRISTGRCPREFRNVLAAGLAALCGIMVIGLAEYTWFYPRNMFLFWFLFAVIGSALKLSASPVEAAEIRD